MIVNDRAEHWSRKLGAVQEVAEALKSTLDLDSIAETACRAVVQLFGVDHSALLLYDPDLRRGKVCAEYPAIVGTKGTIVPVLGIPAEENMAFDGQPIIVEDVPRQESLGEVRDILGAFDIRSILFVPVAIQGTSLGSFSLDMIGRRGTFSGEEVELCKLLAAQLAVAVRNAQSFQASQHQVHLLEMLRKTALDVTSELDSDVVLKTIVERAVSLLHAKGGGIEVYAPERHELTVVADCGPSRTVVGEVLKEGEGVAGKLVHCQDPAMIIPDYNEWPDRPARYAGGSPFGALIAVRLVWREQMVGVLYVDDEVGREFSQEDVTLLQLFGDYAATALVTAKLVQELNQRETHWKRLVAGSPVGVIANDSAGRITDFNERAEVMFGYRRDEILGEHVQLLFDKPQEPFLIGNILRASPEGRIADYETLAVSKTGEIFPARMALTWLYDENRRQAGCVAYVQDLRDLEDKRRLFVQSALYHQITDSIQAAEDLDEVLHIVLTGVTAGYGLAFNSAALLLLDPSGTALVARMGVGHVDAASALYDWDTMRARGADDFDVFREQLRSQTLRATPLGQRIAGLEIPLLDDRDNLLVDVLRSGHWIVVNEEQEIGCLPQEFLDAYQPTTPLAVVALRSRQRVVGLLVADNRITRTPISSESLLSLITYANSAAIAIDSKGLLSETRQAHDRLETSFLASTALVSSHDPGAVLNEIVEQARNAAGASWVSAILIDEQAGQVRNLVLTGTDKNYDIRSVIRPNGLSMQVMRTGQPVAIQSVLRERERVNEFMLRDGIAAALCLPLTVEGTRIGVMWLHYKEPHHFPSYEIKALQLFANQAAAAFETATLLDHLRRARNTAGVVARAITAETLEKTLQAVAQGTVDTLEADAVALYVYDRRKDKLQHPPTLVGVWHPDRARARSEVTRDSIVYEMLRHDDIYIAADVLTDPYFNGRRFSVEEAIRSCITVPLKVGGECVGVMFVNFRTPHEFDEDELKDIRLFADQAAVAIQSAQLYEEVSRHAEALRSIQATSAAVSSVLDLDNLLPVIAENAATFFDAPASSLMLWDEKNENLVIRAACGLRREYVAGQGIARSVVEQLVARGGMGPQVLDLRVNPPGKLDLVRTEELCTVLVSPLLIGHELIGILSVYSRHEPRSFSDREKELAGVFAQYAAIAILNAKQLRLRDGLLRAAQVVTAGGELHPALEVIAENVRETLSCDVVALYACDMSKGQISYPSVVVGQLLTPNARADWSLVTKDSVLPLERLQADSVIRKLIAQRSSCFAAQVSEDPVFGGSPFAIRERIASSAGIPLMIADDIVGFLFINYRTPHDFSDEEKQAVEVFAAQAALAIQSARRYDELRHTKGLIGSRSALAWMGMANSTWRHGIEGDAVNIRNAAQLVLEDLPPESPSRPKLELIARLAKGILARPITPPLSSGEGAMLVNVNQLITERIRQLSVTDRYQGVILELHLSPEADAGVWVSPEWLRTALDHLLDNAAGAGQRTDHQRIRVHSRRKAGEVEIAIEDNGPGIPADVAPKLFRERILGKGMGMGLMMVQVIVQAYGGDVKMERPGPGDTTMTISLPLARLQSDWPAGAS